MSAEPVAPKREISVASTSASAKKEVDHTTFVAERVPYYKKRIELFEDYHKRHVSKKTSKLGPIGAYVPLSVVSAAVLNTSGSHQTNIHKIVLYISLEHHRAHREPFLSFPPSSPPLFQQPSPLQVADIEAAKAANVPITVTLPDGHTRQGIKGATTPFEIAQAISPGLAKKAIVSVVNGKEWDLARPLTGDCDMKICTFDDPEGKDVSHTPKKCLLPRKHFLMPNVSLSHTLPLSLTPSAPPPIRPTGTRPRTC